MTIHRMRSDIQMDFVFTYQSSKFEIWVGEVCPQMTDLEINMELVSWMVELDGGVALQTL